MAILKQDMVRAFRTKGFWIAIVLLCVIFIHAIRLNTNLDGSVSTYEIISVAMGLSGFTPFAAIFPVLGYSVVFCEEYHSGYLKMITSRTSWKNYGRIRIISVAVSGGIVIAIPIMLVCIIGYIFGIHGMPQNGLYAGTHIQYLIENYGDAYLLIGKVVLGFLFGAMWALVGLGFSVWFCNRYVSLIAPFILYEVMWILMYKIPYLNPIYMIRGDDLGSYFLSGIMEIMYILISLVFVWGGLRRRIYDE